jgi:toxin ParE1/3/4
VILWWSTAARNDLRDIMNWIAEDDPVRADSFIDAITRAGEKLLEAPRGYPLIRQIADKGIRRRVYRGYLLIYRVTDDQLNILRVLHGTRDYHSLLDKLEDGD